MGSDLSRATRISVINPLVTFYEDNMSPVLLRLSAYSFAGLSGNICKVALNVNKMLPASKEHRLLLEMLILQE